MKTSSDGDNCYAFCPPTPFSARHLYQHSQCLVLLLATMYSSPACQAASILLIREPAELLISPRAFYISTYLFKWTVWIH